MIYIHRMFLKTFRIVFFALEGALRMNVRSNRGYFTSLIS